MCIHNNIIYYYGILGGGRRSESQCPPPPPQKKILYATLALMHTEHPAASNDNCAVDHTTGVHDNVIMYRCTHSHVTECWTMIRLSSDMPGIRVPSDFHWIKHSFDIHVLWPKYFVSAYKLHYMTLNNTIKLYLPFVVTDDVIPIVDVEASAPPLLEGITDQLEVTRSTVVLSVSEYCAVQVA